MLSLSTFLLFSGFLSFVQCRDIFGLNIFQNQENDTSRKFLNSKDKFFNETDFDRNQLSHDNYSTIENLSIDADLNKAYYYIPLLWHNFCLPTFLSKKDNSITNVTIACIVEESDDLDFVTFRNFTSVIQEPIMFTLILKCNGGKISMPKHARANLLYSLTVDGCLIHDYQSEVKNTDVDLIPDMMSYYAVTNSKIFTTNKEFLESMRAGEYSKTYQCGPTNAESITIRNVSTIFEKTDPSNHIPDLGDVGTDFFIEQRYVLFKCKYVNLVYYEYSYSNELALQTLLSQLHDAIYNKIEVFNLTSCRLSDIPSIFKNYRFPFKTLNYVDLSKNRISDIGDIRLFYDDNITVGTLDLQYNNITQISKRQLDSWFQEDFLFIDVRNNPFICNCEMRDFVEFMHENSTNLPFRYQYLSDLKCHTPLNLRGKRISSLLLHDIGCEILHTSILKVPIVILCCFIIIFGITTVLSIRYRKEIIILTYTRFNYVFPCQEKVSDADKQYDAFVAYSEADSSWVIHTLLKRLENPENPHRFYLCLHHRDFLVGAAIADNIIHSVENSRHTVIIVSKNFLKSEWCRLEFRMALHQSLLEKKRHLIIVLLENIPPSEFEPELKRCIETLTYVKADDKLFWDKLVFALSDWSKKPRKRVTEETPVTLDNDNNSNQTSPTIKKQENFQMVKHIVTKV